MKCTFPNSICAVSLLAALAMPVQLSAQEQSTTQGSDRYIVTDQAPSGPVLGQGYFITNREWISGAAAAADGSMHATLWKRGVEIDMSKGGGFGGPNSLSFGGNQKGQSVGGAETSNADPVGEDFCGFAGDGDSILRHVSAVCVATRRDGTAPNAGRQQWHREPDQQSGHCGRAGGRLPSQTRTALGPKSFTSSRSFGNKARSGASLPSAVIRTESHSRSTKVEMLRVLRARASTFSPTLLIDLAPLHARALLAKRQTDRPRHSGRTIRQCRFKPQQ